MSAQPFTLSLFGREVLRVGRATEPPPKITSASPMSGILAGMRTNAWGYTAERNKADRLAAYTGYVHSCFSARAQRDAVARYWLIDKRDGSRVPEDKAPVPYAYFRKPNPVMSESFLKTLIYVWLGLTGTAPVLKIRNAMGVPIMQWPLLPNRVTALYDPVDWVRYEYVDDGGRTVKIPAKDMVYYRNPHPTKLFDGLGDLEAAGLFHDTDVLLWAFQREMFSKGPFSSWILQYPEAVAMNQDEQRLVAESFEQIVGDREHPAYPVVLGQGVEAKQFPVTNKGLEVPTINEEIKERIRSAAHVSKTTLGEVPGESRANVEGAEVGLARFTEARLRMIDEENERSVLPEWDERYEGEFEDVSPEDLDFALRQETADLTAKVLTINEVRERRGLVAVAWGDVPWATAGETQITDGAEGEGADLAPGAPAADVQKTALNGAQMEAAKATLIDVGSGTLSKPAAIALLTLSFPDVDASALAAMVNAVEVKEPQPVPATLKPFAGKPAVPPQDEEDDEEDESDERQTRADDAGAERRAATYRAWLAVQDPAERAVLKTVRAEFRKHEAAILARLEEKAPRFLDKLAGWTRKHAEQYFATRSIVDDIAHMSEFEDEFVKALKPQLLLLYTGAGKAALKSVKGGTAFVVNDLGIEQIANHLTKSTDSILRTNYEAIRNSLREGFLKGEGVEDLAARIRDIYDGIERGRALVIARTETVYPANAGALEGYKQADVEYVEWITTMDGNERESHGAMDGVRVKLGENFHVPAFDKVPADTMQAPGGGRVAGQNIQCRCAVGAIGPWD